MALLWAMTKIHMNLLHLSDMHFGPRHWLGNNKKLLEKINSYDVDIVLNTGDSTTDALQNEFEVIRPLNRDNCRKHHLYLDSHTTGISDHFTDINFLKKITVNSEAILLVCLDSNELYKDTGFVDKEILTAVSERIRSEVYDRILLLNHHSILDTDSDPLFNSKIVIEFVREHKINHVFCGHTHQLSIMKSTDLYHGHSFVQYKNGSLSSANTPNDTNMFISAIFFAAIATFIFGTLSTNAAFFILYFLTVFAKAAGWPSIANIIRASFSENRHGRI